MAITRGVQWTLFQAGGATRATFTNVIPAPRGPERPERDQAGMTRKDSDLSAAKQVYM
jgi:hypothetical protein